MLKRISKSCHLTVTPPVVGHDAKTHVHAIISPKPSERTRLFLPIPTLHILVCPLLRAPSRRSNEPRVATPQKSKKNYLISPMLGDSIPHLYSKTPIYKRKSIFVFCMFECIHRQGFSIKTYHEFFRVFMCLRSNSAGRPKYARVENRVRRSNTLRVS